ncbi:MAG: HEPN domain-containing protein [Ferruginibacter sp.]
MSSIDKNQHPVDVHLDALYEAYLLVVIATEIKTDKTATLNRKKQALHRVSIISICAALETFLEVAIESSLKCIISNISSSDNIPENIKIRISKRLIESKDERQIWRISGLGWKDEVMANYLLLKDKFNTPRPKQIDDFLYQTLGIKNISHHWHWKGHSYSDSSKKLNEFMDLRGDITHRIFADKHIYFNMINNYIEFIYRIITITSNIIRQNVFKIVKVYPWEVRNVEKIWK